MLPVDLENYLREISRVLKPEGKCLITLFIINEESESLIRSGNSFYNFTYNMSGCMSISEKDPEAAIAYSEEFIFRLFEKYGLEISQPIHYGSWCKRDNFLSFQDLIIAKKMMI
jgi:ubiquinone/menaquinone biosynthesis C-methylase UbiE